MAAMQRGQEEAPIELLIAVTVLTFVLVIGFYTYQNMCASQFEQKMRASLAKFANDLETIHTGFPGTKIPSELDFLPTGCPGNVESVRLLKGTQGVCKARTGSDSCFMLTVIAKTESGTEIRIMEPVKIPTDTAIKNEGDRFTDPNTNQIINCVNDDIEDMGTVFTGALNPFLPQTCFSWSMNLYVLTLEKTDDGTIIIHG